MEIHNASRIDGLVHSLFLSPDKLKYVQTPSLNWVNP